MTKDSMTFQQVQDEHWSKDKNKRRRPDHPVVQAVFEPLADIVASCIDNPKQSSVLDVGCGNGFLQWPLEKRFGVVEGLDYSEEMLRVNPCQTKHLGSSTALPFEDRSFDVVVAANMLHHLSVENRIQTVAEMARVAKQFVVSFEPNRNNPFVYVFSHFIPAERMVLNFSPAYVRGLFKDAGLGQIHSQIESWIIPNSIPTFWIPIGQAIAKTPLKQIGFDICTIGKVL